MQSIAFGGGYLLRSLENVDSATGPIQSILHNLFLGVALVSVLIAFVCSVASSRSIVKPIAAIVSHLRNAVRTGELPEFKNAGSSILEIRELTESYNRAAFSVHEAQEHLHSGICGVCRIAGQCIGCSRSVHRRP